MASVLKPSAPTVIVDNGDDDDILLHIPADAHTFHILHWRKSRWVAAPRKAGWQRSRVFARNVRLTRTRNRHGAWKYVLETNIP
jgi:hypothetical protein